MSSSILPQSITQDPSGFCAQRKSSGAHQDHSLYKYNLFGQCWLNPCTGPFLYIMDTGYL
eukprot:1159183-Pelagomonas_calceolata.AAC.18